MVLREETHTKKHPDSGKKIALTDGPDHLVVLNDRNGVELVFGEEVDDIVDEGSWARRKRVGRHDIVYPEAAGGRGRLRVR
jgi:hypothetical protein